MIRVWLRDDQFERIAALLPGKASDPGRTAADNRLFVEAVLWIARTGSPWRDLPPSFGLWNSVYQRFARWSRSGVWHRAFAQLALDADFEEVRASPAWPFMPRSSVSMASRATTPASGA